MTIPLKKLGVRDLLIYLRDALDAEDFIFFFALKGNRQEKSKRHAKNKNQSNRSPVLDDAALVFSSPNEERVIPEKDDDPARGGNKSRKNKDSV